MKRRTQVIITGTVIAGGFAILTFLERRRPLRTQREAQVPRAARNLTLGAIALGLAQLVHVPENEQPAGLLKWMRVPRPLQTIAGVVLMDYTLWWWHRWNHELPLLWRFHLVHHVDRDMDASTAFRFHFGEHVLSFFYRAAQVKMIGATSFAVWLWQTLLFASIMFHHSNVRLPIATESRLVRWIVTPRMHGIHHSELREHARTNYSSLLSCWDALHRTLLLDVPQETIEIGAPGFERDVPLKAALTLPFRNPH